MENNYKRKIEVIFNPHVILPIWLYFMVNFHVMFNSPLSNLVLLAVIRRTILSFYFLEFFHQ